MEGSIGRGIAQICGQYGYFVSLIDINNSALTGAQENITWSLEKLFQKGQIKEHPKKILKRIKFLKKPDNNKVELLIECVPEDLALKKKVLGYYDQICPEETIFASNTSALPIGTLAVSTMRQDRFIGTHFASPPVIQKLVEMIPSLLTSQSTIQYTKAFLKKIDRDIVEVKKDIAGFVMNRIFLIAAGEAIRILEKGIASIAEIDRAMRLGFGWAKGPLEAADLAGIDIIRGAMLSIWQNTGNPTFYPPETLTSLVEAGRLGRKVGRGFYKYPIPKSN